ncbi:interferon-induced protein with tetratricopeptide repeats 3 [Rhynchocyon petersi]
MYNLLAYIKDLNGQHEAALECLQQAEGFIQQEHVDQAEIRSLVTWGNYAWVYYHMGRFSEAQDYVDRVRQVCEKFSNPYSIECPELDSEEGWTWLKCGGNRNERAKVCFEKALEERPNNPEFSSGLAIAMYRLDEKPQMQFPLDTLKQAIQLSPNNPYIKILLALKLQKIKRQVEGEALVEEALEEAPKQTDVLRSAAKFYQTKGDLDKAIELFLRALKSMPNNGHLCYHIGCCYGEKVNQMQNSKEYMASENRETIDKLRECAIDYLKQALEKKIDHPLAYAKLSELLAQKDQCGDAKEYYQLAFSKDAERQPLHQCNGSSQEYHMKSTDAALQHYLEDMQISKHSAEKDRMKCQLQNTAENQSSTTAPNYWYHQGLRHKINGNVLQAVECYEKELGRLLRNTPSSLSSLFLPVSEPAEGNEEKDQST